MARFVGYRVGSRAEVVNAGTLSMKAFADPVYPEQWPVATEPLYVRHDPNHPLAVPAGKHYDPARVPELVSATELRHLIAASERTTAAEVLSSTEMAQPVKADGYGDEGTGPPPPAQRRTRR